MSEIAFVSPPELSLGAAQSGLRACPVERADLVEGKLRELARSGVSVAIVTEDLVGGRIDDLRKSLGGGGMALLVVPRQESPRVHLGRLRRRFAAALGVDVWETTVKRSRGGTK